MRAVRPLFTASASKRLIVLFLSGRCHEDYGTWISFSLDLMQ